MKHLIWPLKCCVRRLSLTLQDARINRRWVTQGKRFLVTRHAARKPFFYGDFLDWVAETYPETRALFELRQLPCRIEDNDDYLLHIPWLQDPLESWSPQTYRQAIRLAADCDRLGIPIINRVDHHTFAAKTEGARRIAQAGFRTPKIFPITNIKEFRETHCGLELPLIVRENYGHGGRIQRIETREELRSIPWHRYQSPIAVEFIPVQDAQDGLYRRYRHLVAGEIGLSQGLHISAAWEVRGHNRVYNAASVQEEQAFAAAPNPLHEQFLVARRNLELDFVAFDYSYDLEGRVVVWEANLYPSISYPQHPDRQYVRRACERSFAAMLWLYLNRAGLETPEGLKEFAVGQTPAVKRQAA